MRITVPEGFAKLANVICGCGRPEDAWEVVLKHLEEFSLRGEDWNKRNFEFINSGEAHIVAHLLTYLGLLEHGGSVGGSWTTASGDAVLAFLREHGHEWMDKTGVAFAVPVEDGTDMFIGGDMGAW